MKKKSISKKRMLFAILLAAVFVVLAVFFSVEIFQIKSENAVLLAKKQRLEQLLSDENLRKEMLENEEVYIQTKKYIEEKAKAIGYVYPDEIIFRKED